MNNSNTTAYERILDALRAHGSKVTENSNCTKATAQCPGHDDSNPSLSVTRSDGRALVWCHGPCDTRDVLAALGLSMADLYDERRATYRYTDGRIVERYYANGKKKFSQTGAKEATSALYHLDRLQEAGEGEVFLVEGEADVHAVEAEGGVATTAPQGADSFHKVDVSPLAGRHVTVVVDRDAGGDKWATQVRAKLAGVAAMYRFVHAEVGCKDASDHIAAGHGLTRWVRYQPPEEPPDAAPLAPDPDAALAEREAVRHAAAVREEVGRIKARQAAQAIIRAEGRPPMPRLIGLDEALEEPDDEAVYRIDRLWPRDGRIILSAQAKTGKTTMRDNTLRSLIDGDPFLGQYPVTPITDGTIAVVDNELSRDTGRRWLRDQRIRDQRRIKAVWLKDKKRGGGVASFDLLDDGRRDEWAQQFRELNTRALIIDCLGPLLAAAGLDENSNLDVGRYLAAIDALLYDAGIPEFMLIHHMGHSGDRARGASRLRDWPDAEWRLMKGPGGSGEDDPTAPRYLSASGRDVAEPEGELAYEPQGRRLSMIGGSRAQARAARGDQEAAAFAPAVVEWVRQHPGSSASEIEDAHRALGITRDQCRAARRWAVRDKILCTHKAAKRRENHYLTNQCAECAAVRDRALAH